MAEDSQIPELAHQMTTPVFIYSGWNKASEFAVGWITGEGTVRNVQEAKDFAERVIGISHVEVHVRRFQ